MHQIRKDSKDCGNGRQLYLQNSEKKDDKRISKTTKLLKKELTK